MKRLIAGDLRGLELPRDLGVLRSEAEKALLGEISLMPLYSALSEHHPMALGELAVGPKALRGPQAAEAALQMSATLEKTMQPKALYPRLVQLHPDSASEILNTALQRFPSESWVNNLAKKLKIIPGARALASAKGTPEFEAACHKHAHLHHVDALVELASEGQLEPIAALICAGHKDEAVHAASRVLDHDPKSNVIAWFSAASGPDCERLICSLIPHLRTKEALEMLLNRSEAFPRAHRLLHTLLPAVR